MHQRYFNNPVKGFLSAILFLSLSFVCHAQGNFRQLVKEADLAFSRKNFHQASNLYEQALQIRPSDLKAREKLGITFYYCGDYARSIGYLEAALYQNRRPGADIHHYLGKSLHRQHRYKEATVQYKAFLRTANKRDERKAGIANEIIRCYHGYQTTFLTPLAAVENLGEQVNSRLNEIKPVISPNHPDKIYFSSDRENINPTGKITEGNFNMYSTEIVRGEWIPAQIFLQQYQSAKHEILQDINADGSALLFFRGESPQNGTLLADSFGVQTAIPLQAELPVAMEFGDRDIFQFSDSLILFSSRRKGGQGGYDLYYTTRDNTGSWQAPRNMGPQINSSFDELYPFLSANGRVLYFSSNSTESVGGFDVFKSEYNDNTMTWSKPVNLGSPVNSASDDLGFRSDFSGKRFFISSNRPGGSGGFDLYIGYPREVLHGQNMELLPPSYADVPAYKEQLAKLASTNGAPVTKESPEIKEANGFKLEPLFIRETDVQISPANKEKLDKLADWMSKNTDSRVVLHSHLNTGGNLTFQLFTAVQQAELFASYLNARGIPLDRIHIMGLGAQYPVALNEIDKKPNESASFLNRRIEPIISGEEKPAHDFPDISPFMRDDKGYDYRRRIRDITYRVQFVSLRQMYAGDLMEKFDDCLIEKKAESNIMQYSVGMFKRMSEAIKARDKVRSEGFKDAFIVVYLDGRRLDVKEITPEMAEKYPDLKNFVRFTE